MIGLLPKLLFGSGSKHMFSHPLRKFSKFILFHSFIHTGNTLWFKHNQHERTFINVLRFYPLYPETREYLENNKTDITRFRGVYHGDIYFTPKSPRKALYFFIPRSCNHHVTLKHFQNITCFYYYVLFA